MGRARSWWRRLVRRPDDPVPAQSRLARPGFGPWWTGLAVLATVATVGFVVVIDPLSNHRSGRKNTPHPSHPVPGGTPGPGSGQLPGQVGSSGVPMPRGDLPGWRQIFADDFSGTALSSDWFAYEGQPDGDPGGWFDPSHVMVADGLLTIGGWREPARGDLYVTGGVSNRHAVSRSYGRYDIRFRMDQGTGIAYALLLWPADNQYPPEIDIAEDNGRDRRRMYGVLHPPQGRPVERSVAGDFTQWHTAGLEWTPGRLVFTLDGVPWTTITGDGVPREPMALALQSQAWYCGHTWEACPDATTPARVDLTIDWVTIYAPT
ncbi:MULTISPECIES: family 16 glycosylhydrolase [unclassified Micromonospora]|uniref:glycoside hydrolase family 16 protein n=1 Tax=unclassified Micromonospora TaxID=2617518 RepID=UPI0013757EFB|nr:MULTISPECIES: glycoside hydrolase family 16 protein [unclassified Micromonospora]QKW13419.1 glycoside hydrolase family 16 protein [Verrucosispora sp. NA02020]